MKNIIQTLIIISLGLLLNGCYYDAYIELPPDDTGGPIITDVSFAADIQPLFTAKCASCHNGNTANPDLSAGSAYNNIVPQHVVAGNAESSNLFNKLPGNNHPINTGFSLSADEIALVKAWIDEGAENN